MTLLVVRGGVLSDLDRVLRAARRDFDDGYGREQGLGLCLSVFAAKQADGEARDSVLCRIVTAGHIRNRQIRVADLADVVEAGFRVVQSPPPEEHYDVDLGTLDPPGRLAQMVALFAKPEVNPCPYED